MTQTRTVDETLVKEFEHAGYRVRIHTDPHAERPEREVDDLFLVAGHREVEVRRDGFNPYGDTYALYMPLKDMRARHGKQYNLLPLYGRDFGGCEFRLSLTTDVPYSAVCSADGEQIGWVYVRKGAGFRNIRKAADMLIGEWNAYLAGEVYGFVVSEPTDGADGKPVHVDSCWGFIGELEYCEQAGREAAEQARAWETRQEQEIARCCAL